MTDCIFFLPPPTAPSLSLSLSLSSLCCLLPCPAPACLWVFGKDRSPTCGPAASPLCVQPTAACSLSLLSSSIHISAELAAGLLHCTAFHFIACMALLPLLLTAGPMALSTHSLMVRTSSTDSIMYATTMNQRADPP